MPNHAGTCVYNKGIEVTEHVVTRDHKWARAHPCELRALGYLVARFGETVGKYDLYDALYPNKDRGDKIIGVLIAGIRKFLPALGLRLVTIHGIGFRLEDAE